jgi:uncharacterized LabA/DUF88 family protein
MPGIYVYVDGESHFIRSQQCAKELFGEAADLEHLKNKFNPQVGHHTYADAKAKFFWDTSFWPEGGGAAELERAVYFTSIVGDVDEAHRVKVMLRGANFEPHVIVEPRALAKQRGSVLSQTGVIEKAKGVDIALAVRVLEDAQRNNFDLCKLVTSDADYLPVIEAIRRMGKRVSVIGYRSGVAAQSPFDYVPEVFVDLKPIIQNRFHYVAPSQQEP